MPLCCCICQTRSSGRFSQSKSYESEFVKCFKVDGRNGLICDSCKKCVYKWRNENELNFNQRVDSRKSDFKPKKFERKEDFAKRVEKVANSPATQTSVKETKIVTVDRLPGEIIVNICRYLGKKDVLCFKALHVLVFMRQVVTLFRGKNFVSGTSKCLKKAYQESVWVRCGTRSTLS